MKRLTEDIIKEEALILFMENGYEGTSLSNIGEKVGIKKQSIYSHFKNKDDLFLKVMNEVIHKEIKSLHMFFKEVEQENLFDVLYKLIIRFRERFIYENDNLKFLVRMMFIPPVHLEEVVINEVLTYYSALEQSVSTLFEANKELLSVVPEQATAAFLNIIDGLLVELNYINVASFDERLRASWNVYRTGVEK